jgi:hypothetical protein
MAEIHGAVVFKAVTSGDSLAAVVTTLLNFHDRSGSPDPPYIDHTVKSWKTVFRIIEKRKFTAEIFF